MTCSLLKVKTKLLDLFMFFLKVSHLKLKTKVLNYIHDIGEISNLNSFSTAATAGMAASFVPTFIFQAFLYLIYLNK